MNYSGVARLLSSAASTNGALVSAVARRAHRAIGANVGGSTVYLKIYNKATAPTVGTDTPMMTIALPAYTAFAIPLDAGVDLGLGYALTGASADNDTTAIAAGAIVGLNIVYA